MHASHPRLTGCRVAARDRAGSSMRTRVKWSIRAEDSVGGESAALDQLHRHAFDSLWRGGLRLGGHLLEIDLDGRLARLIAHANGCADGARDAHQLVLVPVAN